MKTKISIVAILFLLFGTVTNCVGSPNVDSASVKTTKPDIICSDTNIFINHTVKYFNNVVNIDQPTIITTGTIVGVTGLLFMLDKPLQSLFQKNQSKFNDGLFRYTEFYGATGTAIVLTGSVYGAGLLFGNTEIRTTGVLMLESLAYSAVITSILKSTLGRSRPYTNEGNLKFRGLQFKTGTTSLPSGHTTVAFALSSVLSERIQNISVTIGLYSLASLTAMARVYHNDHWISDTFLGAAIGTATGLFVANNSANEQQTPMSVNVSANGVQFQYSF